MLSKRCVRFVIQIFFCFDVYHAIIRKDEMYPAIAKPLIGLFAIIVQTGLIALPIISTICSDSIAIGYRIMIGGSIGAALAAIKEYFTDMERERNLQSTIDEMKRVCAEKHQQYETKHQQYEEHLSNNDKKHEQHEAKHQQYDTKHQQHEERFTNIHNDIEWNKPFVYAPFDPPSP